MRSVAQSVLAGLGLAAMLAGCGSIGSQLPTAMGGEPTNAPAQAATSYSYPAVHDMPPARPETPMTDEQQVQMEKDLTDAREKQDAAVKAEAERDAADNAATAPAPNPKAAKAAKK